MEKIGARNFEKENFNGLKNSYAPNSRTMECCEPNKKPIDATENIKLWLGYSTTCVPFQQLATRKVYIKLRETSIYARKQAIIASNSFSQICAKNYISESPLEFIEERRRDCEIFIDIPVEKFAAASINYTIPFDITIAGVLDQNQLSPIFNSFQALTRNYASLFLQLWTQDFLQDLKVVWLNKSDNLTNNYLAYQMIAPEKSDQIYLQDFADPKSNSISV
ncbi:MAG: hypothetical protein EZS28_049138 [Streblomastix strix]|uniref:Uncharacterized protein n=1 Tax=Streblomastix strix TaxID=222440 RepID=A0A5J4TCW5_9EUKA|nr:MAG: hypothetical protein EZS28_049138 [Streblomastix strix]